jgi:NitT/TauT family transport system substrate-binding protein
MYAVAEQNLAAPTRLEISTSELAQDNYRAFAERRIDVLATTLYSAIQFHEQGTPTVVILITDYSNGADGIIARPGIEQVADLAGHRVGVESGSISHFVLMRALEEAGLDESDVQVVHIGVSESIDAIAQDKVAAAVVWEPILSEYADTFDEAPIFTSAALPNEVVDVLVVHPDVLEQRTDDLINLARGWNTAVQGWRDGSPEIQQAMANGLNVDVGQLHQAFTTVELVDLEANTRFLDLKSGESIAPTFDNLVRFMQRTGQFEGAPPTADELISPTIVQAAQRRDAACP